MKILRNPWVTGVLGVVALGVVVYQFKPMFDRYLPKWRARPAAASPAKAANTTAPAASGSRGGDGLTASSPSSNSGNGLIPAPAPYNNPQANGYIDRGYIESRLAQWIDSPARDPFLLVVDKQPEKVIPIDEAPAEVTKWKLYAIWRQTGSRLAAINGGIYQEGDEIVGWKIMRIEDDQVVFRGTNRIERLAFAGRAAPGPGVTATNQLKTNRGATFRSPMRMGNSRTNLYYQP